MNIYEVHLDNTEDTLVKVLSASSIETAISRTIRSAKRNKTLDEIDKRIFVKAILIRKNTTFQEFRDSGDLIKWQKGE